MSRARVLLLEDDAALRGLLLEVLGLEDFDVIACESFNDVLAAARGGRGDLILADFWGGSQRTLDDSGRDEIRQLADHAPVVLLTGRSWASELSAQELGASALMRKPFDLEDLLQVIAHVLQRET